MLNVFTYWEHAPKARKWPYIEFCLDTIRSKCLDGCLFHHITSANIDKYIPDGILHPSWKNIKELGVKSDCVRAAVLMQYGGLYIDADTLMLQSPKELDTGHECGFMTWSTPPRRVIAGYIYCCPDSEVAKKWVANINAMLEQGKHGWTDLGEKCLTPAVDSSENTINWPLATFLPIEIDTEVQRFFSVSTWKVPDQSIAIGLNHSLMTRKYAGEMRSAGHENASFKKRSQDSKLTIHKIFSKSRSSQSQMRIGVCVPTFRRPKLLGHLISCFESQNYEDRLLIAYDDHGEIAESSGDRWKIVSRNEPHTSLGEKRNAIAEMFGDSVDAFVFWDDDDIFLPDALSAVENALSRSDWCRASQVLVRGSRDLTRCKTYWREDKSDKAFQCTWGVTQSAFWSVGGFDSVSLGEDLRLAKKLRDAKISEADPIAMGWNPYAVSSPYGNEHFSWTVKDYEKWKDVAKSDGEFRVADHPFSLKIGDHVNDRSWKGDWYDDEVR
jgi:hypothetical protein